MKKCRSTAERTDEHGIKERGGMGDRTSEQVARNVEEGEPL